jgi:hypothetical protein
MRRSGLYPIQHIIFLIILLGGIVFPEIASAQSREYLLKAGYIEKFTHFIEWPEKPTDKDSTFLIKVMGENRFGTALDEIFSKVTVKNRKVRIAYISAVSDIKNCRILIISASVKSEQAEKILSYTTGKPILTISENKGYGEKGTMINMLVLDNYIRYEINPNALKKSGFVASSLLLNSATIIDTDE